jgi:hypothetical protein
MERILLSDFLLEWLAQEDSKEFTIVFRELSVQIKKAVKARELTGVVPDGYYSVSDGKPVRIKEPKESNKGLIQDFKGIKASMSDWFSLPEHKEKNGFLVPKTRKKLTPKNTDDMTDEEFLQATEQYAEFLNRIPKQRAKRNNS